MNLNLLMRLLLSCATALGLCFVGAFLLIDFYDKIQSPYKNPGLWVACCLWGCFSWFTGGLVFFFARWA